MAEVHANKLKKIKYVTIHHSVTAKAADINDLRAQAAVMERYHRQKRIAKSYPSKTNNEFGYSWIAYHYLIAQNGDSLQVQSLEWQRVHATDTRRGVKSHNLYGVSVCFVGNFDTKRPSEASLKAAGRIVREIEKKHKVNVTVLGHKHTAVFATACPGRFLDSVVKTKIVKYANKPPKTEKPSPEADNSKTIKALNDTIIQRNDAVDRLSGELAICRKSNSDIRRKLLKDNETVKHLREEVEKVTEELRDKNEKLINESVKCQEYEKRISGLVKNNEELSRTVLGLEVSLGQRAKADNWFKGLIDKIKQLLGPVK